MKYLYNIYYYFLFKIKNRHKPLPPLTKKQTECFIQVGNAAFKCGVTGHELAEAINKLKK